MAGHQVAAKFIAQPQRTFQVHPRSHGPGSELGMRQRFGRSIDGEPVGAERHDGQAAAGAGNGRTQADGRFGQEGRRRVDDKPHILAGADGFDRTDAAKGVYDTGEHEACLEYSLSMSLPMEVTQWRRKRGMRSSVSIPKACTAGQPSPPMTAGAWNQAMRSTRSARSSAAAIWPPPSTRMRVSPALPSA